MRKLVLLLAILSVNTFQTSAQDTRVYHDTNLVVVDEEPSFGSSFLLGHFTETFSVNSSELIYKVKEDLSEIKNLLESKIPGTIYICNYEIGTNFEYLRLILDDKNQLLYSVKLDTQLPCIEIGVEQIDNINSEVVTKREITKNDRVYRFMYNSHLQSYTFSPATIVGSKSNFHYEVDEVPEVGFDEFLKCISEIKNLVDSK